MAEFNAPNRLFGEMIIPAISTSNAMTFDSLETDGSSSHRMFYTGLLNSVDAIQGVRFMLNTGTFTGGRITLLGYKGN